MAAGVLLDDRDNYAASNNYRIYWHPTARRWFFIPTGIDQTFGGNSTTVFGAKGVLFQKCLASERCTQEYVAAVGDVAGKFERLNLTADMDTLLAAIGSASQDDPKKPYTTGEMMSARDAMRAFIARRPSDIRAALAPCMTNGRDGAGGDCEGVVAIHVASNQCLEVVSRGAQVDAGRARLAPCHGGSRQRWHVVATGEAFELAVDGNGNCLGVANDSTDDGAIVQQSACSGTRGELFSLRSRMEATPLVATHSGKCIVPTPTSPGGTAALVQAACTQDGANVAPATVHLPIETPFATPNPPQPFGATVYSFASQPGLGRSARRRNMKIQALAYQLAVMGIAVIFGSQTVIVHAQQSAADILTFLVTNQSVVTGAPDRDLAAAQATSDTISRALRANLATLPLTTSSGAFAYRLNPDLGTMERVTRSFGPLFIERALTAGARQVSFNLTFQHLQFGSLDGHDLRDGSFVTTANQFVDERAPFDIDQLTLNIDASVATLSGNIGVTDRLDVGFAVPIISLRLDGTRVDTYRGRAFTQARASASATGLADVVVRSKYRLFDANGMGFASAVDVRLPTGNPDDLLGTGAVSVRFQESDHSRRNAFRVTSTRESAWVVCRAR